eukprot:scaffold530922_cov17-Prasinocladus_malaysianus.AAC.1
MHVCGIERVVHMSLGHLAPGAVLLPAHAAEQRRNIALNLRTHRSIRGRLRQSASLSQQAGFGIQAGIIATEMGEDNAGDVFDYDAQDEMAGTEELDKVR